MRDITKHIVHCSDSNTGTVKEIRAWHKARKWRDVGYHFIIRRDGEIECGRMIDEIGAHCQGRNHHSVGTCLIGKKEFTPKQFDALNRVDRMLKSIYPDMTTHPHNEFNPHKTCPNFDLKEVLQCQL